MKYNLNKTLVSDLLFTAFMLFLIIIFKNNSIYIPLHWDELTVYSAPAFHLYENFFRSLADPQTFSFNPFGVQLVALPFLYLFGKSYVALKLCAVFCSCLTLLFTFLITKSLSGRFAA
jgi:hypothetical protein